MSFGDDLELEARGYLSVHSARPIQHGANKASAAM